MATRLLVEVSYRDHISPLLKELYCISINSDNLFLLSVPSHSMVRQGVPGGRAFSVVASHFSNVIPSEAHLVANLLSFTKLLIMSFIPSV